MPGQQVSQRRPAALVGHMQQINAGLLLEQFADQVRQTATAGGRVGNLTRLRFGQLQKVI